MRSPINGTHIRFSHTIVLIGIIICFRKGNFSINFTTSIACNYNYSSYCVNQRPCMLLKSLQLSCTSIAARHFEENDLRLVNNSECMIVNSLVFLLYYNYI